MITKLINRVFGVYALKNLRADFDVMADRMKLDADSDATKLLFIWFILGHVNSADKDSHFNRHYHGDQPTGGPH